MVRRIARILVDVLKEEGGPGVEETLVVASKISMLLKERPEAMVSSETLFGSQPLSTQPPAITTKEGKGSNRVAV